MRLLIVLMMTLMGFSAAAQQFEITQEHKDRAAEVVKQMTLEEKIAYIAGYKNWYIMPIDRLGLPAVRMADGPQGVRNNTKSTLYPSGVAAAATWDVDLINQMGVSLGKDSRARGVHILLGPGANMYRSPLCGRNFEYFGEDPFLAGEIAASYINGVQSQGVMACVKHFAGNNQEYARHSVSSDVDERTLHEIYFPAFEKAVKKGNVATIMTSYNPLNGVRASESRYLNQEVLREMWGFDGIIMSDWTSCYSPVNIAYWGVDLEMPCAQTMKPELIKQLVEQGVVDVRALDKKCQNIIQTIFAYEFDKRPQLDSTLPENNPECDAVAHDLSRAAIVMLKNEDNFLPVQKGKFFVCGPHAEVIVTGGGSGFVTPLITCSVAEGMLQAGKKCKTTVYKELGVECPENVYTDKTKAVRGVKTEIFSNINLSGNPVNSYVSDKVFMDNSAAEAHEDLVRENISSRHTFVYAPEKTENYIVTVRANDGCRVFINGEKVADAWDGDSWNNVAFNYSFEAGKEYDFVVEHFNKAGGIGLEMWFDYPLEDKIASAKGLKEADCVVVCLGHNRQTERENHDRTFELPEGQLEYLDEVLKYNKNVVVVLNGGGGIEMASWMHKVKAVLMAWYPGQQGGLAVSEIITGKISPSGKLPISIEKVITDNPCHENYYENVDRVRSPKINPYSRVEYREGIFMGYRGYEKSGVEPLFPFGYGLSYTSFEYSDLGITTDGDEFVVNFTVKNTGKYAGAEVAQVYVGDDKCSLVRPVKELKGFDKVYLKPGESATLSVRLGDEAFRYFDPIERRFIVEPGTFTVHVGASSADIRLTGTIDIK